MSKIFKYHFSVERPKRPPQGPAADIDVEAVMLADSLLSEMNAQAKISTALLGEDSSDIEILKSDMIKFSQEGEERPNVTLDTADVRKYK